MKDITPYNDKGQCHGYWERYREDGSLWYKRTFINDTEHGYWEYHFNDYMIIKRFYIR